MNRNARISVLLLVQAVALLFCNFAFANPEFKVVGKARLRYEDTQGYSGTSFQRAGFWSVRLRPGFTLNTDSDTSIYFEPQFAKILGRDYSYTQVVDSSGSVAYNENLHMHQGYLKLKLSEEFEFKGGRMAMDYGGAAIIGFADWGVFGRAFDGVLLNYSSELVKVDIAQVKLKSTPNTIDADKELNILYSTWMLAEALKAFEVYGLYETNRALGANDHRHSIGSRVKAKIDHFDIGAEYAFEKGSSAYFTGDQTGNMAFAELGYSFDVAKLRVGAEWNSANESWREWYPTTKSHLGRNDVVGRRNLTAIALRTKAEVTDKIGMTLDYWNYTRTSTSATPYTIRDTTTVGTTVASSSADIGSSLEFAVKYQMSEKVEYGIGAALFFQGAYLKENFGDRAMTDFYATANIQL